MRLMFVPDVARGLGEWRGCEQLKPLVLGDYGNFGARICRALAMEPSVKLLIGGRNLIRAQALAIKLGMEVSPLLSTTPLRVAGLRAVGLIKRPARLAALLNRAARAMDFMGSSLGGVVIKVEGIGASCALSTRSWHIAADDDHRPEIPCMAAILLVRRLVRRQVLPVGASTCIGLLKLADFEPEFTR